jgi:DNA topoisomerase IB
VKVIRECQELKGQHLFQYLDDHGKRRPVGSEQVNAYLHEIMDAEFTAKDFRTWSGTLTAFEIMLNTPLPEFPTKRALKSCIVAAMRKVAEELRNTPAVCRKSYINPLVFSAWQKGNLHRCIQEPTEGMQETLECLVLFFLREEKARSAAKIP